MKLPPVLCPSIALLDQSWVRQDSELRIVGAALGSIAELVSQDLVHVVLTLTSTEIIQKFDFQRAGSYPLLTDIYQHLALWALQQRGVHIIDCSDTVGWEPHPLPPNCANCGEAELWMDEVGKLLVQHNSVRKGGEYFIGIACHHGFSGNDPLQYDATANNRFPLVGATTYSDLEPAFEWVISQDIMRQSVRFTSARNNLHLLGGDVCATKGTSHHSVKFKSGRTWVLDSNFDPVREDHLRELAPITKLPYEFVKATLITGQRPCTARLKLSPFRTVNFEH